MADSRKPDRYAGSDDAIHNAVAGTGRFLVRLVRSVVVVARNDWPYALGYVALVAVLYLAGLRTIAHLSTPWDDHQAVSLLIPAAIVGVLVAVVRENESNRSSGRLRQQVEGVVAEGIQTPPGEDAVHPRARIRAKRGAVKSVEIAPLPYRMSQNAGREFETLWRSRVPTPPDADDWRFAWRWTDNRVEITPRKVTPLPVRVVLQPTDAPRGLAFRLGMELDANDEPVWVWWDPDAADPHSLVTGPTKAGKSVAMRGLLSQALAGGVDKWNVIIADPKGVDYRWADGLPGIVRYAGDDAAQALDAAVAAMRERQAWMETNAPRTATNLGEVENNPFPNLLVLIDETAEVMELGDKDRRAETKDALGSLARRARFVNIVLVAATQRPDVKIIPGEIRGNLGTRVLVGEGEQGHKQMAFGSQAVEPLPANYPKGRGRVMVGGGKPREFQIAWTDPQTILDVHDPPEDEEEDVPPPAGELEPGAFPEPPDDVPESGWSAYPAEPDTVPDEAGAQDSRPPNTAKPADREIVVELPAEDDEDDGFMPVDPPPSRTRRTNREDRP